VEVTGIDPVTSRKPSVRAGGMPDVPACVVVWVGWLRLFGAA